MNILTGSQNPWNSAIIEKIKALPNEIEVKIGRQGDNEESLYIGPESIIEEQQEEQNNYTGQLILKVADEFEIRISRLLDEYFNKK